VCVLYFIPTLFHHIVMASRHQLFCLEQLNGMYLFLNHSTQITANSLYMYTLYIALFLLALLFVVGLVVVLLFVFLPLAKNKKNNLLSFIVVQ